MHKDSRKIKSRIKSAFKKLFSENIIALSNFTCCGNCGTSEINRIMKKDNFKGWAFYHNQDNQDINDYGNSYISFGDSKDIAKKIVNALQNAKLKVSWNGKMNTRIFVQGLK